MVLLVCAIVFAETGLLVGGFFLPGDSMLFTAGLLVSTGAIEFNLWAMCAMIIVAAIIGNQTGYLIGSKAGPAIFNKPDSRLFKKENVESAHAFFEKHGGKALILARFVPIIRTFVPVIVGVAQMDKRKFFLFNVIGAVLWGGGVTLLGAWLGQFEWVGNNIDIIFIVIVLISVIPIFIEIGRGDSWPSAGPRPKAPTPWKSSSRSTRAASTASTKAQATAQSAAKRHPAQRGGAFCVHEGTSSNRPRTTPTQWREATRGTPAPPVADGVLLLRAKLGTAPIHPGRLQHGVVAEAALPPARLAQERPFQLAILHGLAGNAVGTRDRQRSRTDERSAAERVRNVRELCQQQVQVGDVIAVPAGPACRKNTGARPAHQRPIRSRQRWPGGQSLPPRPWP